jgi:hypothetical protein
VYPVGSFDVGAEDTQTFNYGTRWAILPAASSLFELQPEMFRARIDWSCTEGGVLRIESQHGRNWIPVLDFGKWDDVHASYYMPY